MTNKDNDQVLKAVGNVLKNLKAELQQEIASKTDPTQALYKSILYRRGVENRDLVLGFANAFLFKRSHVVRGENLPSIFKRAMADPDAQAPEPQPGLPRVLPTHSSTSATLLITRSWATQPMKQVRQDCAERARALEKSDYDFDVTGAVLSHARDFDHAKGVQSSLRKHLNDVRATLALLRGLDHEPIDSRLYDAAATMRAVGLEAKTIDPNAGLTDMTEVIDALSATEAKMAEDLQVLASNSANTAKEFCRLLVAAIASGEVSLPILGEKLFDNEELKLKALLPSDVIDELETEHDWSWQKAHWEWNSATAHNRESSKILVSACKKSMLATLAAKSKSAARAKRDDALLRELQVEEQDRHKTTAMRESAK